MYSVGNKVVHPCHGAGTIVNIAAKGIGELRHRYYIIDIHDASRTKRVMVPVKRADSLGLRRVGRPAVLRTILAYCRQQPEEDEVERDYRKRRVITSEQLKSGCYRQLVEIVRVLSFIGSERKLGFSERERLDQAKQMLAAELSLAANEDVERALEEVEWNVDQMVCSGTA